MVDAVTHTDAMREAFMVVLNSPDNAYFLTVSFVDGLSDKKIENAFKFFLTPLNEWSYGKYAYNKKGKSILGFAVKERQRNGNIHYHCIIRDPDGKLEAIRPFAESVERSLRRVKGVRPVPVLPPGGDGRFLTNTPPSKPRVRYVHGNLMTSEGVDVRPCATDYYGRMGLVQYCTKEFEQWWRPRAERYDAIGVLSAKTVYFG